ncbi:hypothetical protein [Cupriavidus sp. UYPR2.512]|uniref:hypothetical protein n=1 Tax=Cupriavidus sp. UYPR2.512 TaxID=1080187 RepID=UPI00036A7842|nr:hypothetical protein [Cupriavidus sp. UYPR2.512]UIF89307.1 hypothetical protein KAF44_30545 [Cupriavidus necator]
MGADHWEEVAEAPPHNCRMLASLGMLCDSGGTFGEKRGSSLYEQILQAAVNTRRLIGLPYDALLEQLGVREPQAHPLFDVAQKVLSVMMQDAVGDYETPDQVPEWAWVKANATYVHGRNGNDGIWESILNLGCAFKGDPGRLAPIIAAARTEGAAYLIIHQGT